AVRAHEMQVALLMPYPLELRLRHANVKLLDEAQIANRAQSPVYRRDVYIRVGAFYLGEDLLRGGMASLVPQCGQDEHALRRDLLSRLSQNRADVSLAAHFSP